MAATRQTFVFPDQEALGRFLNGLHEGVSDFASTSRPTPAMAGARSFPRSFWDDLLDRSKGWRFVASTGRKESFVYGYQEHVHEADLEYLHERDPHVHTINRLPAVHTWFELPRTYESQIDDFFLELTELGFPDAAMSADEVARRDGAAFIYIRAPGRSSAPLQRGAKPIGFDFIYKKQIDPNSIQYARAPTPLNRQHNIQFLDIEATEAVRSDDDDLVPGLRTAERETQNVRIHGSRLIALREDRSTRAWHGRPKIIPAYDAVWNLRDIEWQQAHAQFEGDPIAIEVQVADNGLPFDIDDEQRAQLEEEASEFVSGGRHLFSPVEGVAIKRVGGQKLMDPTHAIRLEASRIAMNCELPVNMILASSRGSEQVTDQDVMAYQSNIDIRRKTFAWPILAHLVRLGKHWGSLDMEARLPHPGRIQWPHIRTYNIRELAYARKTAASTMDTAFMWGRDIPPDIAELFPEKPGGKIYVQDPDAFQQQGPPDKFQSSHRPPVWAQDILDRLEHIEAKVEKPVQFTVVEDEE